MTMNTILLLIALFAILNAAQSFVINNCHHRKPSALLPLSATTSSNNPQLWLDLCGTALTPQAALDYFEQEGLSPQTLVDQILIDDDTTTTEGSNQQTTFNKNVFAASADGYKLLSTIDHEVAGTIVKLDEAGGLLLDPFPAMSALSKGQWVLVEHAKSQGEDERQSSISSCLQLLSASCGDGSFLLGGGDDNVAATSNGDDDNGAGGGIALRCNTKSQLFHLATTIKGMEHDGAVESTASGILLTRSSSTTADNDDDDSNGATQFAIALPFDELLWQSASFVFREDLTDEQ